MKIVIYIDAFLLIKDSMFLKNLHCAAPDKPVIISDFTGYSGGYYKINSRKKRELKIRHFSVTILSVPVITEWFSLSGNFTGCATLTVCRFSNINFFVIIIFDI